MSQKYKYSITIAIYKFIIFVNLNEMYDYFLKYSYFMISLNRYCRRKYFDFFSIVEIFVKLIKNSRNQFFFKTINYLSFNVEFNKFKNDIFSFVFSKTKKRDEFCDNFKNNVNNFTIQLIVVVRKTFCELNYTLFIIYSSRNRNYH